MAATGALLVGFLAGLVSFKVKSRWCPHCGAMTTADRPGRTTPPCASSAPDRIGPMVTTEPEERCRRVWIDTGSGPGHEVLMPLEEPE